MVDGGEFVFDCDLEFRSNCLFEFSSDVYLEFLPDCDLELSSDALFINFLGFLPVESLIFFSVVF